jgi:hypothetical protein
MVKELRMFMQSKWNSPDGLAAAGSGIVALSSSSLSKSWEEAAGLMGMGVEEVFPFFFLAGVEVSCGVVVASLMSAVRLWEDVWFIEADKAARLCMPVKIFEWQSQNLLPGEFHFDSENEDEDNAE